MIENKKNKTEINKLKEFTKEQLIEIIDKTADKNISFKEEITKLINLKKDDFEHTNNISKYNSLFNEAEKIISEFNEYGGGPEEKEEIVYRNLPEIVNLFNKGKLDEEIKVDFIERCFEEYYYGNSGFEDLLRDSVLKVCNNKNDWLFIIEKLKKSDSHYDAEIVINIYQEKLKDDETYLKLRMASLHNGIEYYNLVEYYFKKDEIEKAICFAKEGIEKGDGRIIDLIDFLLKYYTNKNEYENILKYSLLHFKEEPTFEGYIKIKKLCNISDLDKVLYELHSIINSYGDDELKAKVNYLNKNYQPILDYVKSCSRNLYFSIHGKEWAQKIENHFPKEILKLYLDNVEQILKYKIAKEYFIAEYYLIRIRYIFLKIIRTQKEWDNMIRSLKQKSIKLPSFQKMLQRLEDKR